MAGLTDAGSLVFRIKAETDKNSFEEGKKQIDNTSESMSKLIGTARNAAVALVSMKTLGKLGSLVEVETSAYHTAEALGITTDSLNEWKAAAKIAGVDANSLVGSMGRLGSVLSHIDINGEGLDAYSKKLQEIGLGITDLQDKNGNWLSADKAYQKIIAKGQEEYNKATTTEERLRVTTIMGDILGDAGQNFFIELTSRLKESIADFLVGADTTVYTNDDSNKKAADFAAELRELTTTTKSILSLFGSEVAGEMTPYLDEINKFIKEHKNEIITGINNTAKAVGIIAAETVLIVDKLYNWTKSEKGKKALEGGKQALDASIGATIGMISSLYHGEGANYIFNDYPQYTKDFFEGLGKMATAFIPSEEDDTEHKKIKDGILRPDGTVTQVAPDDWVFAARNVGDLAKAFIPPMPAMAGGNNEFVINQTFNINGSSDLPQVLRQQAYQGTQDGLMQIMEQSSQRLQLMSGTR